MPHFTYLFNLALDPISKFKLSQLQRVQSVVFILDPLTSFPKLNGYQQVAVYNNTTKLVQGPIVLQENHQNCFVCSLV